MRRSREECLLNLFLLPEVDAAFLWVLTLASPLLKLNKLSWHCLT